MRRMLWLMAVLAVASGLALAIVLLLGIDDRPIVTAKPLLTTAEIARAQQLVKLYDLRKLTIASHQMIKVSPQDLEWTLDYLAGLYVRSSVRVLMQNGGARVLSTTELPKSPFGRYTNFERRLMATLDTDSPD